MNALSKVGRPTKLDESTVVKLESILKIGGTVEEASSYAGINKTTYYRWLEENEDFATKMDAAQHYADIVAKNIVVDTLVKDKDLSTAKWWLEKRQFKDQPPGPNQQYNQFNLFAVDKEKMEKMKKSFQEYMLEEKQ